MSVMMAAINGSEIVFVCKCGYKRELRKGWQGQAEQYNHLLYGVVTHREAAELDVKYHQCTTYLRARKRAKNWKVAAL